MSVGGVSVKNPVPVRSFSALTPLCQDILLPLEFGILCLEVVMLCFEFTQQRSDAPTFLTRG